MHARAHIHTDTDTHTDLLQGQRRPLWAVGVYLEPPWCAVHRSFANSVRMSELMETKMYLYVDAPPGPREGANESQGQQASLGPLVGEFFFTGLTSRLRD